MMQRKSSIFVGVFFLALGLGAASYNELTQADAGRLLYRGSTGSITVYEFVEPTLNGKWLCRTGSSQEEVVINPEMVRVFPFSAKDTDFAKDMYILYNVMHDKFAYIKYCQICEKESGKYPTPRVEMAFKFLKAEKEFIEAWDKKLEEYRGKVTERGTIAAREEAKKLGKVFRNDIRDNDDDNSGSSCSSGGCSSGRSSCSTCPYQMPQWITVGGNSSSSGKRSKKHVFMSAEEKKMLTNLSKTVQSCKPLEIIKATVLQHRDYYLATLMYQHFTLNLKKHFFHKGEYLKKGKEEMDSFGEQIVNNYNFSRNENRVAEAEFCKLCPNINGDWKIEDIQSVTQLVKIVDKAYVAYAKSRQISLEFDFDKWGDCMLYVLATVPGASFAAAERKFFEEKLKEYKDIYGGN